MPASKSFKTKEDYNAWFRAYRAANRDKFREYNRSYNRKWRQENGYHNEVASRERYPEKEKARSLLRYSVKIGSTIKLGCEVCGNERSEAHHDDYSRPLDVRWLCRRHHTEVHRPYVPATWEVQPLTTHVTDKKVRIRGRTTVSRIRVNLSPCTFCGSKRVPFRPHIKCHEARVRISLAQTSKQDRDI